MSDQPTQTRVKTLFLVKPDMISRDDINRIEKECGIIVAECADPEGVRALDPPLSASADAVAFASWKTMQWILFHDGGYATSFSKGTITDRFVRLMLNSHMEQPKTVQKVKR